MSSEEVPKKGIGGVVINEGPDFRVEIQELDVPEPSMFYARICVVEPYGKMDKYC